MPAYEIVVKVEFDRSYYFEADSPEQAMEIYKSHEYDPEEHSDFEFSAGDFEEQSQTAKTPTETDDAENWLAECRKWKAEKRTALEMRMAGELGYSDTDPST